MTKKRLHNALSLIINLSIIFFTIDANLYNFRSDIIRNELVFGFSGIKSFCFFTVLSNDLLAISSLITLFFEVKNIVSDEYLLPKWVFDLKFSATAATTVTFMTVALFLAPWAGLSGRGYFSLYTANNFYLHFLSPALAIVVLSLFEKTGEFNKKDVFFGLIPTAAYSIIYIVMVAFVGESNGGWPDFYGLTFGGKLYLAPISAISMLAATLLFSYLLYLPHKRRTTSD